MTSEESFARYEAIRSEKYPYLERDESEWKAYKNDSQIREKIGRRYSEWLDDKERREKKQ